MTNNQKHQIKLDLLQRAYELNIDYLGESGRKYQETIINSFDYFKNIEDKQVVQDMLFAQYKLVLEVVAKTFDFGYIITKIKEIGKGKEIKS